MKIKNMFLFAFALSGMTALIYEIVWSRPLQLIFGSTIYAVSTILTTFFIGFALGSFVFRNFADKTKNPVLLFAMIEFGIGLYGLIILYLFKILPGIYLSSNQIQGTQFLQFLIIFLILIIPSSLFGASWPVVNKIYINSEKFGRDAGKLYSFNSFGAFAGSIGAGFLLIPLLGIRTTSILVACTNIFIAVIILIFSNKQKGGKNEY